MIPATERTVDVMPLGRRGRYGLTPRQQNLYLAIIAHVDATGWMPSLRQMAGYAGIRNASTAHFEVVQLVERGWLTKDADGSLTFLEPVLRHLKPVAV
jgi:SOS-response transcriptional repressor LexA